jgi:hypothetical protein
MVMLLFRSSYCHQEKWRGDSRTLQLLLLFVSRLFAVRHHPNIRFYLLTRCRCRCRHRCRRSSSMRVQFRIPTSIGGTLFLHNLLEKVYSQLGHTRARAGLYVLLNVIWVRSLLSLVDRTFGTALARSSCDDFSASNEYIKCVCVVTYRYSNHA